MLSSLQLECKVDKVEADVTKMSVNVVIVSKFLSADLELPKKKVGHLEFFRLFH
tara:strand:+ start:220 stop:381 length:162 start_codon:yes stop_codon:yes gene_type:complete